MKKLLSIALAISTLVFTANVANVHEQKSSNGFIEPDKRLIKKETEDARLEFQNKFGYSADTTLISVEDKLSKPKLTEDWKRFTEVFSW